MMSPEYLAGFFDGEGCLTILVCKNKPSHFTPSVIFANTNLEVLVTIQRQHGGRIHPLSRRKTEWSQAHSLCFSGTNAVKQILQVIRPFVIVKKQEVEFFFTEWLQKVKRSGNNRQPVSIEQMEIRKELKAKLSSFKSRARPAA